jgi:hypothetical protein
MICRCKGTVGIHSLIKVRTFPFPFVHTTCRMSAPYCSLVLRTDISGLTVRVGTVPNIFNFQIGPTPPPEFFSIKSIYSMRTVPCIRTTFDRLYAQQRIVDPSSVDPFNNNNMALYVRQLDARQEIYYSQLISLFQTVYLYNATAYAYAARTNTTPFYYTFKTSSELSRYREANALINKLYNVVEGYPVSSLFYLPFPPFCAS